MMARLSKAVLGLSRREKGLLALLIGLAAPVALIFLVALPMLDARAVAADRLSATVAQAMWVAARHAEWRDLQAQSGQSGQSDTEPVGLSGIEAALTDAALRGGVSTMENNASGGITLQMADVPFVDVARFVETLETSLGYRVELLRVVPEDTPGEVSVDLEIVPLS